MRQFYKKNHDSNLKQTLKQLAQIKFAKYNIKTTH